MTCRLAGAIWLLIVTLATLGGPFDLSARAENDETVGTVTHLRLPRYVSLRYDKTNVREGPSKTHRTVWVFQHAALPVEITAEFDVWRRIRDSEGAEGWVLATLLVGKRTALVAPWKKGEVFKLYTEPKDTSDLAAELQAGVLGSVKSCDGRAWCRFSGNGFDGYIRQSLLWGVYPNEKL